MLSHQTSGEPFDREPHLNRPIKFSDSRGHLTKGADFGSGQLIVRDVFWSMSGRHVVRGFHFHADPAEHTKFVQVVTGVIDDFVIDLRSKVRTYGEIANHRMTSDSGILVIPEGFGHGVISLENNTRVLYCTTYAHNPALDSGLSMLEVGIPIPSDAIMSDRDLSFPRFRDFQGPF